MKFWTTNISRYTVCACTWSTLDRYCQKFTATCQDVLALGLQAADKRSVERKSFFRAYDEALKQNQDKSVERVMAYETCKAEVSVIYMYYLDSQQFCYIMYTIILFYSC